jgi:hypothetical protein
LIFIGLKAKAYFSTSFELPRSLGFLFAFPEKEHNPLSSNKPRNRNF